MESDREVAKETSRGNLSERKDSEAQILELERAESVSLDGHQAKTRSQAKRNRKKMREQEPGS